MMQIADAAFLLATVFAIYVALVTVIITGRMTHRTKHVTRFCIIGAGAIAMWAIQKTATMDWQPTPLNFAHAIAVVLAALVILSHRRIDT